MLLLISEKIAYLVYGMELFSALILYVLCTKPGDEDLKILDTEFLLV